MTRHLTAIALLAGGAVVLAACGVPAMAGPLEGEQRDIGGTATAIDLDGAGRLSLSTGSPSIEVTAPERLLDDIITQVRDGVLHVGLHPGTRFVDARDITYDVVLPRVDGIRVDGAGSVHADLEPTDSLTISLDGAGSADVRGIDVSDLRVEITGVGDVELEGEADRQSVVIDGLGSYRGRELQSEEAVVKVDGAGRAEVEASELLDASVDGLGSISYGGDAVVTRHVDGVGSISER